LKEGAFTRCCHSHLHSGQGLNRTEIHRRDAYGGRGLLARAIARAPNGTSIGIRTDIEDGAAVLVTVWDSALSETSPDPEDTADAETEDSGEAADLGPVVLQHLAQTMGASLAFSGHPGRGGLSILRLPVAPPETD